jgi:ABC-type dipeptide/oligopeptide/nickel transport system permease component
MGLRILEGIQQRIPLQVVTIALAIGLTIQLIGLLLDLAYVVIDPRLGGRV